MASRDGDGGRLTDVDVTLLEDDHLAVDLVDNVVNVLAAGSAKCVHGSSQSRCTAPWRCLHVVRVREHLVAGKDVLKNEHGG